MIVREMRGMRPRHGRDVEWIAGVGWCGPDWRKMSWRYMVEEETGLPELVDLGELLDAHQDDEDFCRYVLELEPGETYFGGGGAMPEFAVHCVEETE
jgi:hypothetical protein